MIIYIVLECKLPGDLVLEEIADAYPEFIGETTEYDKKQMLEEKRPRSWCKSVSAFANGAGGTLIFGVANDDSIVGLADSKRDSEIISEQIKTKLDPIPRFDSSLRLVDSGKELIILKILAGNETPYYYVGDGNHIAYHSAEINVIRNTSRKCFKR